MKIIKILLILIITQTATAQTASKTVDSKVTKVTVFPEGAQVTRSAHTSVTTGKSELVFGGISPYIDASSIQVSGDGAFTILSVSPQANKLKEQKKRKEIEEIEKSKETFDKQMILQKAMLDVYEKEEKMLEANDKIGGSNVGVKAADLTASLDLHRTRLRELKLAEIDYNEKIKKIKDTLDVIDAEIRVLSYTKEVSTTDIIVSISAKESSAGNFTISYVVKNAGWYPSYDLRVDDITKPLTLDYKANVYQNTGEEWKDVRITFSNGNPNESGVAPVLKPLILTNNNMTYTTHRYPINPNIREIYGQVTDEKGEGLIQATIMIVGTTIGTTTDVDGNYRLQVPQGSSQIKVNYLGYEPLTLNISTEKMNITLHEQMKRLDEVLVTSSSIENLEARVAGVQINGIKREDKRRANSYLDKDNSSNIDYSEQQQNATALTFELATPYTVINDGKTRAVDMKEQDIPAAFDYFSVPKLDKGIYLIAHVPNWIDYNLLEGEVNIYYEGTYLGKTLFNLSGAEDTLHLSLGRDKALSISRTRVKEFSKKQFLSDKKIVSAGYDISIRNNKKFPINLVIEDQIPVSAEKEISVDNTSYPGGQLDEQTGQVTWKFNLEPAKEKKLNISYSVKYPKTYRVQIN